MPGSGYPLIGGWSVNGTGAVNGRRAIRFDGTSDAMSSSFGANTFTPSGTTIFVVFRTTTTLQQTFVALRATSGLNDGANQAFTFISRYSSTGSLFGSFDGTSSDNTSTQDLNTSANDGAPHLFAASTTSGSGATVTLRADGGEVTNTYADTSQDNPVDLYSVGALVNLSSNRLAGDVAEILIYNRTLTPAEVAQNQAFLTAEYGIPEPGSAGLLAVATAALLARRRVRG